MTDKNKKRKMEKGRQKNENWKNPQKDVTRRRGSQPRKRSFSEPLSDETNDG
jgi:hypothetical protein